MPSVTRRAHVRTALLCHKIADSLSEAEELQEQVAALLGATSTQRLPEVGCPMVAYLIPLGTM
jgi:hypothetical protein